MAMFANIPPVGPSPSSSAEPTTGPNRIPSDRAVAFSRTALSSSPRPTKSCSISCSAGPHSAPAMPCTVSSTHASGMDSVPVANASAQPSDTVINMICATWITRRQSNRSASAPAPLATVGRRRYIRFPLDSPRTGAGSRERLL
ncbi:MAG: hypothetical protein BGO26_10310 [Actinobacteria bacterium 69-20]|nr:MAG: hypothetical protein BGO26_10310 [Actinobacteria bacterium 69-20]